jgi:predicted phosphodiesterase
MEEKENLSKLEKYLKKENISPSEAIITIQSSKHIPSKDKYLPLSGKSFSYLYFSDTHICHKAFKENLFDKMIRVIKKEKPDFVIHSGDHLEGMSGRPGHIYELTHIGYNQQMDYCTELYKQIPINIYGIDGNHDEWYEKQNNGGLIVGKELEHRLKNYTTLGQDEGTLNVNGIKIYLYHGGDGTAYADSYKIQKLMESFTGGDKPDIIHSGHYHKSLYLFNRNIHGFESGTLMGQSRFMRGKKIRAHLGFGLVKINYSKKGVDSLTHTFYPGWEYKDVDKYIDIK